MADDRRGQELEDDGAHRPDSSVLKPIAYAVIAILLIAIVLLATGVVKMSPLGGP